MITLALGLATVIAASLALMFRCGPTYYAKGYREETFRSIKPGISEKEVQDRLGEPLEKVRQANGTLLWTGPTAIVQMTHATSNGDGSTSTVGQSKQ
jgi:hypothetical protein